MMINGTAFSRAQASAFGRSSVKRAGVKSSAFADALQKNRDSIVLSAKDSGNATAITENGRKSTGSNVLTDVQKQYLRDKYQLSDSSPSRSDLNSLLTDLTNMGALSYQDYAAADMRQGPPLGTATITWSPAPPTDSLSDSKSYAEYFQNTALQEQKEADYISKYYGSNLSSGYNSFIASHQRIAKLLDSLIQA